VFQKGWFWLYRHRHRQQEVTLPPLPKPGWLRLLPRVVFLLLAVAFTLASLRIVRPPICRYLCDQEPCPPGYCRCGEQGAGFPFFVVSDNSCGSSPTGGWGKVGPEDSPNPVGFALNVVFYYSILWLLWKALLGIRLLPKPYFVVALVAMVSPVIYGLTLLYPPGPRWRTPPPPVPSPEQLNWELIAAIERAHVIEYGTSLTPPPAPHFYWVGPSEISYSANESERIIEYETNQPAASVRQFYITELPKESWRHRCTLGRLGHSMKQFWTRWRLNQPCDFFEFPVGVEWIDVYERGAPRRRSELLGVFIFEQGSGGWFHDGRLVQLREFR
jgi:hypothetical protein